MHDLGFEVYYIPYTRGGAKPYKDWAAFQRLKKLYSEIEPSLVHSFQAKPVVMGNIALRKNKNVKVINTITGLGHAYTSSLFAQKYVSLFYYFAFKHGFSGTYKTEISFLEVINYISKNSTHQS